MKKLIFIMLFLSIIIFSFGCATLNVSTPKKVEPEPQPFRIRNFAVCTQVPRFEDFTAVKEIPISTDFWIYLSFDNLSTIENPDGTKTVYFGLNFTIYGPDKNPVFSYELANVDNPVTIKKLPRINWLALPSHVPSDANLGTYEIQINIEDGLANVFLSTNLFFEVVEGKVVI